MTIDTETAALTPEREARLRLESAIEDLNAGGSAERVALAVDNLIMERLQFLLGSEEFQRCVRLANKISPSSEYGYDVPAFHRKVHRK